MIDGFALAANTGAADASAVPVARNCLRFILIGLYHAAGAAPYRRSRNRKTCTACSRCAA